MYHYFFEGGGGWSISEKCWELLGSVAALIGLNSICHQRVTAIIFLGPGALCLSFALFDLLTFNLQLIIAVETRDKC